MFHGCAKPKEFRFDPHVISGGYFTVFEGVFRTPRFNISTGGGAGGRSSNCMWIAKRSLPICAMIVEVPGSLCGFGNGNTLFLRFFITTLMPRIRALASLRTLVPENYRMMRPHQCTYKGREFIHLSLMDQSNMLPLVILERSMTNLSAARTCYLR